MHNVFLHIWNNEQKSWENRSIKLSIIPNIGDTIALKSDGPWYLIKQRTIVGFEAEFEVELWSVETSNTENLSEFH